MYYPLNSCCILLVIFSLSYHLRCVSSKQEFGWCETTQFQCGNITAGFPFWGGNRPEPCGHASLELHCNKDSNATIIISDQEYYVLNVDQASYTLTLVRADLRGHFCSAKFITTNFTLDIFEILPTYKNLTLYNCNYAKGLPSNITCLHKGGVSVSEVIKYQVDDLFPQSVYCNESFTINVPQSFFLRENEIDLDLFESVLKKGFEVKVKIDEINCQECSSSGGICGFNSTTQVCCKTTSPSGVVSCVPKRQPSAKELYSRCNTPFHCGNQRDLLYPFWIPGREECGHPDFKLNCIGGFAEVSISSVKFRILEADYISRIIRLARSDYISNLCPQDPPIAPFDENVLLFVPNTELLTIYYGCGDFSISRPVYDPTYLRELYCHGQDELRNYYVTRNISSPLLDGVRDILNFLRKSCLIRVSIPASGHALNTIQKSQTVDYLEEALKQGFELGVNRDCSMCIDSGGACGYNHDSSEFICYCNNGPYQRTCRSEKSGTVIIILIGLGLLAVVVLLVIFTLFLRKRKRSHEHRKQNLKALIPLKHYSYTQVKRITKSFAEVVGKGGFGTVYKGNLSDGSIVAVKVLKDSKGNGEDFINEVASMSKTSHVNIVSLLGFCSEGTKRAIIYEYLENGSLDQFISSNNSMNLDWLTLYGIALGVARGLEYLHYGCKTRIVHFDIKPQNVLLDENLCPKVSDFGLSQLCARKESTMSLLDTRGTIGYIAPEMISRVYGSVSHKSDVYSYGMLVLEMMGATNKSSTENSAFGTSSMYFPEWIYKDLEQGDNKRLVGHEITNENGEIAKKMTLVGLWCIQSFPSDRPPMNKVVEMLEGSLDALEVPPRPVPKSSWVAKESSSAFEIWSKY